MAESCFYKTEASPTNEEIERALGPCLPLWTRWTGFAGRTYGVEGTWTRWAAAKSAWNLRFRRNEKALMALHPQTGRIFVELVLGKVEAERALGLTLGEEVARIVREAPQLRDGRWIYVRVTTAGDAADVERLLLAKARPPRARGGTPH